MASYFYRQGETNMKKIAITVFIMYMIAIIGDMDYNNDVVEFKAYCDGVKQGIHPDYKKSLANCE